MDERTAPEQDRIRRAAFGITAAFEGSKGYANYQTYDAGIISYGRFQYTLASGSLGRVLINYLELSTSDTAARLRDYQDRVRVRDATLRSDETFKTLMIQAADEDGMKEAQDKVVGVSYWLPAQDSAGSRGIVTPLGQALLFDMAIQHGPAHKLTQTAEQQLGAPPKSKLIENGLTEEQLIRQVAQVRKNYLYDFAARNNLPGVRRRADFWVDLVEHADWQLQGDADGYVYVYGKPVQVKTPAGVKVAVPAGTTMAAQPSSDQPPSAQPGAPAAVEQPGQPVNGTYTTREILTVRKTPDINGERLGRVRKGRELAVLRQYMPSASEEWLLTDLGWVARRHPEYPGEVFGDLKPG